MASTAWRPLPLPVTDELPPLLVAFETGPSTYSIQVTDLASVWTESLDRRAICVRAWTEETSIDPSDTPQNMTRLLQALRSALDSTAAGHDRTSITLSPASLSSSGGPSSFLEVCSPRGVPGRPHPFFSEPSSQLSQMFSPT